MASRFLAAALLLASLVPAVAGCSNVTTYDDHAVSPQPVYVDYSPQPSPAEIEAARAACEREKTLATVDASLSLATFVLSLASRHHHHRASGYALLRAASDMPAATMRCSPED